MRIAGGSPNGNLEPILKMRLSAQGGVAPPKRDFTSIFMNIKEFIGPTQNAHILAVYARNNDF
jgi:hypothetical protein